MSAFLPHPTLGILETTGWTPAIVALDTMEKQSHITVIQAELNDFLGVVIKINGSISDVEQALVDGREIAQAMNGKPVTHLLRHVSKEALPALLSSDEFNPLIQQPVVQFPKNAQRWDAHRTQVTVSSKNHVVSSKNHVVSSKNHVVSSKNHVDSSASDRSPERDLESASITPNKNPRVASMSQPASNLALGFIETQGFTAVFEAIDTACKAANVNVIGKEKLGGGYVTVVIEGDVAAVKTAIESGKQQVESLGKLIAAHVIPHPSAAVRSLLPKV